MLNVNTSMTFRLFPVFEITEHNVRCLRLPHGEWINLDTTELCSVELSQQLEKVLDGKREEILSLD